MTEIEEGERPEPQEAGLEEEELVEKEESREQVSWFQDYQA